MTRLATLASLAALCLTTAAAHAQAPTKPPAANAPFALPSIDTKWTGDLDGMIKRRLIRILAPYSKPMDQLNKGLFTFAAYMPGPAASDSCAGSPRGAASTPTSGSTTSS